MSRRKRFKKPTVPYPGVVAREELPYPFVYYPWSGPWIEFRSNENTFGVFCTCFNSGLRKYLELYADALSRKNDQYWQIVKGKPIQIIVSPNCFSPEIIDLILYHNATTNPESIMKLLRFEKGLCHLCNNKIPSYSYCVPMYGGVFSQNFGWYIENLTYQFGLRTVSYEQQLSQFADKGLPEEVLEDVAQLDELTGQRANLHLADIPFQTKFDKMTAQATFDKMSKLEKMCGKIHGRIGRWVGNQARDAFGYPLIGEGLTRSDFLSSGGNLDTPSEFVVVVGSILLGSDDRPEALN